MTKERKNNLNKIQESKINLVNMIMTCSIQPNLTNEERCLLREMLEYVVVDHVGKFQHRHNTLQRYFYIASGIYHQSSLRAQEYMEACEYSMFDSNDYEF